MSSTVLLKIGEDLKKFKYNKNISTNELKILISSLFFNLNTNIEGFKDKFGYYYLMKIFYN